MKTKKPLDWEFIGNLIIIIVLLSSAVAYMSDSYFDNNQNNKINKNIPTAEPIIITIGQYQLRETYKWNDIILWIESKENFEKAYGDSLRKTGHTMMFRKDPLCTGPFGEADDWEYDKLCFRYIIQEENPNIIHEIAEKSKGKTLVVIGTLFNNATEFGGPTYWCEVK